MRTLLLMGLAAAAMAGANAARADLVTDWNARSAGLMAQAKLGPPPAIRNMALVQTAVLDTLAGLPAGASPDAAVAAAHHVVLLRLMPTQQAAVDGVVGAALASVPEGVARAAGIAAGERSAAQLLARRGDNGAGAPDMYRPLVAAPGSYAPTAPVAIPQWPGRRPWLLSSPAQLRPAPPPALTGADWAHAFNEVRALGGRASAVRTPEQTDIARFWAEAHITAYHNAVRAVAAQPGRDLLRNARLLAAAAQALDDAMIAVFEAKYHHHFWRPVTAIRNGDIDGNEATPRDPGWTSLIEAPPHPEYPSGHSILAGAVAAVIDADTPDAVFDTGAAGPRGAVRRWRGTDAFVREVSDARVWAGIHYRFATDTGTAMGRHVGALAVQRVLHAAP